MPSRDEEEFEFFEGLYPEEEDLDDPDEDEDLDDIWEREERDELDELYDEARELETEDDSGY